jgi:hypothetical protein
MLMRAAGIPHRAAYTCLRNAGAGQGEAFQTLMTLEADPYEKVRLAVHLLLGRRPLEPALEALGAEGINPVSIAFFGAQKKRIEKLTPRILEFALPSHSWSMPVHVRMAPGRKGLPDGLVLPRKVYIQGIRGFSDLGRRQNFHQLAISSCPSLRDLPGDLSIRKHLEISDCPNLRCIPPGIHVQGLVLIVSCRGLRSIGLPEQGFEDLVLERCGGIAPLPEGLHVRGNLVLDRCLQLQNLPLRLKIGGDLLIGECPRLRALPPDLQVGGQVTRE